MTRIILYTDEWYATFARRKRHDDDDAAFYDTEIDVPEHMIARYEAAEKEFNEARNAIMREAKIGE